MDHESITIVAVTAVLGFLATLTVLFRFWARHLKHQSLGADDFLIVVALVRRANASRRSSLPILTLKSFSHGASVLLILLARFGRVSANMKYTVPGRKLESL